MYSRILQLQEDERGTCDDVDGVVGTGADSVMGKYIVSFHFMMHVTGHSCYYK